MPASLIALVPKFPHENSNLDVLLPSLCRRVDVKLACIESLAIANGRVKVRDENDRALALTDYNAGWVLGFGQRANFLDKMQLLRLTTRSLRWLNSIENLVFRHAKYSDEPLPPPLQSPETYASCRADELAQVVASGGEWIVKPPATSFGRGVFRISRNDRNWRALLDHMTGYGKGEFCLLQRRVDEIDAGELRVLIAGGCYVGAYLRTAVAGTTNLAQGARVSAAKLDDVQLRACADLATQLSDAGIQYAGVDIAFPWLIEINIANPGGLATLVQLGDQEAPRRCADALAQWIERS